MNNFKFKKRLYFIIFFLLFLFFIITVIGVYLFNKNRGSEPFTSSNKNKNIVLIGDSILNNSVYVFKNESVPDLINNKMNSDQIFYNFAKDGATIQDCINHLVNVPQDKIHSLESDTNIFVSAGGNDILNSRDTTNINVNALFDKYVELISAVKKTFYKNENENININIVVLNLYYPFNPSYKIFHPFIKQWNNLLEANQKKLGYQLLKIDSIIVDPNDVIYDVEPSFQGGNKIAEQILNQI
jgi:lysophospholipase L1-like esterase